MVKIKRNEGYKIMEHVFYLSIIYDPTTIAYKVFPKLINHASDILPEISITFPTTVPNSFVILQRPKRRYSKGD